MPILNFKQSLLRTNIRCLIDFIVIAITIFLSADISCAQYSIFNAETFDSKNIEIKADETSFDKKNSEILAYGNVQIVLKLKTGETVIAKGSFAKYNTISEGGEIWGEGTSIKYYVKGSSIPITMHAKKIQFDKNEVSIKAHSDVVVETSSGSIRSDNALFDQKTFSAIFKKDKKRPVAEFWNEDQNQTYTADKITFFNNNDNKKIFMEGDVKGKIKMEGTNDTKN